MADEKPAAKPDAKPAGDKKEAPKDAPQGVDTRLKFEDIVKWVLIIIFLNGLLTSVMNASMFSRGWHGFTPEGIAEACSRPIASVLNPLNGRVLAVKKTISVYDEAGGRQIGTHKANEEGTIRRGPVTIDGITYWYVDFDEGVDGWVDQDDIGWIEREPTLLERFVLFIWNALPYLRYILWFLAAALAIGLSYALRQLTKVRTSVRALTYPPPVAELSPVNKKWERIQAHLNSQAEGDWKIAIIEADIMLDELLDTLGAPGDSIGAKLKTIEKSDFRTLDLAWEAHKVRNQVAHDGADFLLSIHEARRVIGLYEAVFKEFQVI